MKILIRDVRKHVPNMSIDYKSGDVYRIRDSTNKTKKGIAIVDDDDDFITVFINDMVNSMERCDFDEDYVVIENVTNKTNIVFEIAVESKGKKT